MNDHVSDQQLSALHSGSVAFPFGSPLGMSHR